MGPITIFDKSMLQSLNADEALWFDHFFLTNITPLFFVETLADLEKEVHKGRTAERVVGDLALKTPDMGSRPNVHHRSLLQGELLGRGKVSLDRRTIISGGKSVQLNGKSGVFFEQSPEESALQRWHEGKFLDLERLTAKEWRAGLSRINLQQIYEEYKVFYERTPKPKTLAEAKTLADSIIDKPDDTGTILKMGLMMIGLSEEGQGEVLERWSLAGKPPIKSFAPYFRHVFGVDLFFNLAVAADLIGRERPSHKVDLAYVYYLPFCMVFTSNDNLHKRIVPLFLSDDQSFVTGSDLKADLAKLDQLYSALPEEQKARGLFAIASRPPLDASFLVTRLWDKHMAVSWRNGPDHNPPTRTHPEMSKLIREMRELAKAKESLMPVDSDKADHLVIKRKVYGVKGKWKRFPPEVMNARPSEED